MASNVSIRSATPEDVEAIRRVAREAWHAAYDPILGADRVEETVDAWYDPESLVTDDVEPGDRPFFVAVADGTVVGFAEAAPDDDDSDLAHLYRIYVDPDHWGAGIGGALLERVESVLRQRDFERLRLSVLAENDVGIDFYEGNDFERVGVAHNDHLDVEECHYRKRL